MEREKDGLAERVRELTRYIGELDQDEVESVRGELQGLEAAIGAKLYPVEHGPMDRSLLYGRNDG